MQPTVLAETPTTMAELKEGLAKAKKRNDEPSFRVKRTDEYLSGITALSTKDAAELFDRLTKLNIPRLKDTHICKIIDLMPADANDLKVVLQGYTLTVSNENLKKIVDVVKEHSE